MVWLARTRDNGARPRARAAEAGMHFFWRWFVNAVALLIAAWLISGIRLTGSGGRPGTNEWVTLAIVALIFGVVNAIIRPIVVLLTLPLTIVTLGLFMFVVNALMLMLTSRIAGALDLGFRVDGFGAALLGALVISVVGFVLGRLGAAEA
jgi:putative membrane protein